MPKPSLAIIAVAALPLGYAVSAGAVSRVPSAQPLADRPQQGAATAPHVSPDQPVHHQMRAFDRHARVGMILYTGKVGPADRAAAPLVREPNFSATTLPPPE